MVLGSADGLAGLSQEELIQLSAGPGVVPTPKPANPYALSPSVQNSSRGFFSTIAQSIGNVGNWLGQNSQSVVQVLDAAGRLKSGAKVQTAAVNDAYFRNIVNTPPRSWFDDETIPGLKNSVLVLLAGGLILGIVLLSRKGAPQVQP